MAAEAPVKEPWPDGNDGSAVVHHVDRQMMVTLRQTLFLWSPAHREWNAVSRSPTPPPAGRRTGTTAFRQTRLGTPLGHRNVTRSFDRWRARAGVPHLPIHDLRHTHASLLIASGPDPRLVAERLGHASVAFTLQTHGHLWPGRQEPVLAHLPALVGGPQCERPP